MGKEELQKIIDEWKKGNEAPFRKFYRRLYNKTISSIRKLVHSSSDAEEIFMEGLHAFLEHFFMEEKPLPDNAPNYFYMICRNIWFDNHIKKQHPKAFDDYIEIPESEEQYSDHQENVSQQQKVAWARALEQLSGICKQLFELHVEQGRRLKSLMEELGYNTYQSLVQANHRCKKKLTKLVLKEYEALMKN